MVLFRQIIPDGGNVKDGSFSGRHLVQRQFQVQYFREEYRRRELGVSRRVRTCETHSLAEEPDFLLNQVRARKRAVAVTSVELFRISAR